MLGQAQIMETGFDIATKFIANENSLVSAIRNAIKISKNRIINK